MSANSPERFNWNDRQLEDRAKALALRLEGTQQADSYRERRESVLIAVQVALLLLLATTADYVTGPAIIAAAFYVFPVGLAGWRRGPGAGLAAAALAALLNITTEWMHPARPLPNSLVLINQFLHTVILMTIGGLAGLLGEQQHAIAQQRDQITRVVRQLEEDIRAARAIQELLISAPPLLPGVEIGTYLQPARILVGDAIELSLSPEGRLVFVVADVSGKGVPAALAGAALIGMLEDARARYHSPAGTLRYLNQRLVGRLPGEMFVTLFYALLDPERATLTYASAGHDPALLFRRCGGVAELLPTGMVLGVLPDARFEERTLSLAPGDLLFGYTDGITDVPQPTGERLGLERLLALVASSMSLSCPELVRSVARQAIGDEAQPIQDDISLVVVRYLGPPGAG
ncbi:MAG: serine/threonine-protein phosphatase [Armatimonadetes bacterium]|nr:serine/threonine-protein phosphatase [Armatimonadota bacterium]